MGNPKFTYPTGKGLETQATYSQLLVAIEPRYKTVDTKPDRQL